jgi:hypothetical protein
MTTKPLINDSSLIVSKSIGIAKYIATSIVTPFNTQPSSHSSSMTTTRKNYPWNTYTYPPYTSTPTPRSLPYSQQMQVEYNLHPSLKINTPTSLEIPI